MSENELISKFHKLNKLWLIIQILVFLAGAVGWYFTTNARLSYIEKTQTEHAIQFQRMDAELRKKVSVDMVVGQYNNLKAEMNSMDARQEERYNRLIDIIIKK